MRGQTSRKSGGAGTRQTPGEKGTTGTRLLVQSAHRLGERHHLPLVRLDGLEQRIAARRQRGLRPLGPALDATALFPALATSLATAAPAARAALAAPAALAARLAAARRPRAPLRAQLVVAARAARALCEERERLRLLAPAGRERRELRVQPGGGGHTARLLLLSGARLGQAT